MKKLLLPVTASLALFSGCTKECEIHTPVTIYVNMNGFHCTLETIPECYYLDGYDTTRMRNMTLPSFNFLWNEVMVNPADSAVAQYIMTIRSVRAYETTRTESYTENCYEDNGWLWNMLHPPDTYTFHLNGYGIEMEAEVLEVSTGNIYHYAGQIFNEDQATTTPPPGADTTGNPCFEWRQESINTNGHTLNETVDGSIYGAAHGIFRLFKADVCTRQN
ncbi:MAG: hypothetical protein FD123_2080 [Bacteroidetes bacterium]|nr:MAG: hypothetical protein FD123_2080 [Bacteroidota bacterium]